MYKILMPVDGSASSEKAARHVVELAKLTDTLEVHLFYVHPVVDDWGVKSFLREEEVNAVVTAQAEAAMQGASAIFDAAGIRYQCHQAVGKIAELIAQQVDTLDCKQIVMGARGMSALGDLMLGSVSIKVLHLVHVPVTLVKRTPARV